MATAATDRRFLRLPTRSGTSPNARPESERREPRHRRAGRGRARQFRRATLASRAHVRPATGGPRAPPSGPRRRAVDGQSEHRKPRPATTRCSERPLPRCVCRAAPDGDREVDERALGPGRRRRPRRVTRVGIPVGEGGGNAGRRRWCRLSAICQQFVRERDEIGEYRTSRNNMPRRRKWGLSRANRHQLPVDQTAGAGVQVPPPTLGLWVAGGYNPQNACRSGVPKSGASDTFTGRTCPPSNTSHLTGSPGSS
jgi:hypothetical protein